VAEDEFDGIDAAPLEDSDPAIPGALSPTVSATRLIPEPAFPIELLLFLLLPLLEVLRIINDA
jgi:hypothetical protein